MRSTNYKPGGITMDLGFGIGINTNPADAGSIKGTQIPIACECWFTSTGKVLPLMFKVQDANQEIQIIHGIHVRHIEEKNYSGIPSLEYDCIINIQGVSCSVKLIFFKEDCRWVMVLKK